MRRSPCPRPDPLADLRLDNDSLLSTPQAARAVGLAPKTLRAMRCDRTGPRCIKLGGKKQSRVFYRRSDLERWVRERAASASRAPWHEQDTTPREGGVVCGAGAPQTAGPPSRAAGFSETSGSRTARIATTSTATLKQ